MSLLSELVAGCKGSVFVRVNEHRDYYQTVEEALEDLRDSGLRITPERQAQMVAANTIVHVQFYPFTPIGSCSVIGADVDATLERALRVLRGEEEED